MAGPTAAERGTRKPNGPSPAGRVPGGSSSRRPRLPRPRVLLLLVAVLVLGGAGVWALYGSDWLRVERVGVSGTKVLTPREVLAVAEVPVGEPLISVDTGRMEDRLRKELPRIDAVEVARSWPHGIAVRVTERTPVLLIGKQAKFIEVDAKGVRFATVEDAPRGLPLLEWAAARSPSLSRFGESRLVREAVRVVGELPAHVKKDTRTVRVVSYDSVTLKLTHGRSVQWGSGEEGEAKARALTVLMKAEPEARHFDVSAPTAPAASGS
ncbi:cell division protein FtsQ/DivIB [Streptomyces sp. NPDC059176]|uniref:cell division protein FtsQ/DivIB n=1 Tax=unclassified Streptomyces TaxID=2593676 RepID=UPI0036A58690